MGSDVVPGPRLRAQACSNPDPTFRRLANDLTLLFQDIEHHSADTNGNSQYQDPTGSIMLVRLNLNLLYRYRLANAYITNARCTVYGIST